MCFIGEMTTPHNKHDWEVAAKGLIKSEMVQRELDYTRLAERLQAIGFARVTANNLKSKINRGSFSASFLLQALIAMGCEEISIKNLPINQRLAYRTNTPATKHQQQTKSATVHEDSPTAYNSDKTSRDE